MEEIVRVFDISTKVEGSELDSTQRDNIIKIFGELTKEIHLITNCFLNLESEEFEHSPIYYFNESKDKDAFEYKRIAEDLLNAELKADQTRNSTIREGLLFIKAGEKDITIMKLEKLEVIDKDTYEIKSELGKEKDYFKVCAFLGDFNNVKIIDKNRTAAKYWYKKFLGLTRKRTSEDNTDDLLKLISEGKLYKDEIFSRDNYGEIKRFTEYYIFNNKTFDKSDLFNELNSSGLIELIKEDELFSSDSEDIDSDFTISDQALNKKYQRKIQTSEDVTVITNNYLESLRDNQISFDERNKKLTIVVDDEYLANVRENLENEQ